MIVSNNWGPGDAALNTHIIDYIVSLGSRMLFICYLSANVGLKRFCFSPGSQFDLLWSFLSGVTLLIPFGYGLVTVIIFFRRITWWWTNYKGGHLLFVSIAIRSAYHSTSATGKSSRRRSEVHITQHQRRARVAVACFLAFLVVIISLILSFKSSYQLWPVILPITHRVHRFYCT